MTEETTKEAKLDPMNEADLNKFRRLLMTLEGENPDAQQTITDFMRMDNPVEGSNLPTRRDVQLEVYLDIAGKFFFPDLENDPFTVLRDSIATTFKAKGGEKSKQFVDMVRNQPDLSGLQTMPQDAKISVFDKVLGRSHKE